MVAGGTLIVFGLLMLLIRLSNVSLDADFSQDYLASLALLQGHTLYNPEFYNNHPPFDMLLILPLALLPYHAAFLIWSALALLCYGAIGLIVAHELHITLAPHWVALTVGLALCWSPFQEQMALGQWSLLIAACLISCWALLRVGRERLAGVLLGLACLIKLFPGLLIVYLLLRRRWWAAAAASATVALGGLLSLAIVGPSDTLDFFLRIAPANAAALAAFPLNAALAGPISRLLVDAMWVRPLLVAPGLASWLARLASLALVIVLARQCWRAPVTRAGDDTTFAAVCVAMLLISPLTWQHTFMLLLLPFGLLLRQLLDRPSWRGIAMSLLALALVSPPNIDISRALIGLYKPDRMPWFAALPLIAPTAGLLLIWWLLATSLRLRREALS
jgi:alpha-1,2-mannosyltransferase